MLSPETGLRGLSTSPACISTTGGSKPGGGGTALQPSGFGTGCALEPGSYRPRCGTPCAHDGSPETRDARVNLSGSSTFHFPSAGETVIKTAEGRFWLCNDQETPIETAKAPGE